MNVRSALSAVRFSLLLFVLTTCAIVGVLHAQNPVPVPGRNANLASGPAEIDLSVTPPRIRGDFLLKQDNEGSCMFGSRSRKNILCGGNDYGLVEVPGIDPEDVVRDAGAGVYQSADGGDTWESTMLPGHVLDTGSKSLLRNYTAFADITTRGGAAGIAYMTGIAFKSFNNTSIGYLATFLELTNKENDRMPFKHLYTVKFDSVPETLIEDPTKVTAFIDKPWSVVLPPSGNTCTIQMPGIPRQVIPDSPVVIGYTIFANLEKGENLMTSIEMIVKVTNCGRKVGKPRIVSIGHRQNGISLAFSPANPKRVVAVWRRFASTISSLSFSDAIFAVVSTDGGNSWSLPRQVAQICPFQQASTWATARVNTFPTVAIDHTNRISVAWSDRGRDASGACNPTGQSRIVLSTSSNGLSWTPPTIVDQGGVVKDANGTDRMVGHQITPSLTYGGGTMLLLWKDLRETAANYFDEFINEFPLLKAAFGQPLPPPAPPVPGPPFFHHTIELYSKMANVGSTLSWGESRRVSQYKMGKSAGETVATPKQWEIIDLQLFARGTRVFDGDYADGAGPPMLPPDPKAGRMTWMPDTGQGGDPMFFGVWASNRDVHRVPQHTDPTGPPDAEPIPYTPPALTAPLRNYSTGPYPNGIQFTACTPGAGDFTKTMDQNLYGARIGRGLFAFSPGNNKQLNTGAQLEKGSNFQRAFVVIVRNDASVERTFDLTIPFQPDGGGFISFTQFPTPPAIFPQVTQRITVAPKSSASRSVFIIPDDNPATPPLDPRTRARVDVTEVGGTQTATVYFNPDPTAPEIEAPEIEAKEIYTPEIEAATITVHSTAAPEIEAPEIEAPEIEAQSGQAPEIEAPEIEAKSFQTPEIEATTISAPEIEAPEIEAPEIEATPVTTDVTWPVTNTGNTAAGYVVRPTVGGDLSPFHFQLVASRIVKIPTAVDCQPAFSKMNKVAVNIRNANELVDATAQISPEELENATIWVAPGETIFITLRVRGAIAFNPAVNPTTLTVTQQAINTDDLVAGIRVAPEFTSDVSSPGIAFSAEPTDTISGAVMPAVQVLVLNDGEPVAGQAVTLSLRNAPLGTTLSGTLLVLTDATGRATFTNLVVTGLATGLRLVASTTFSPTDTRRAVSREFDVRTIGNTFVVTTNADAGEGSLRSAIAAANANPGLDAITFAIPTVPTIDLASPLPAIVDPVVLDGTTQPNEGPGSVNLNGFDAGEGASGLRITCSFEPVRCATASVVKGMNIRGFTGNGIELIGQGGAKTRISGNVISGNGANGILISGTQAAGNVIQGNQIGGNGFEGSSGNSANGVHIDDAPANLVGGDTPQARNVISANGGEGVRIDGTGDTATSNVIQGNYIGTSLSGLADVGNTLSGIFVVGARSTSILNNVVSGNDGFAGIAICGSPVCGGGVNTGDAIGTVIQANRVGVNVAGDALGNGQYGISLDGMSDALVGGSNVAAANLVAFNGSHGVIVFNPPAAGNQIIGNSIHSNGGLGIELAGAGDPANGVTPNDGVPDADAGPNDLQNFPVLDSAIATSPTALSLTGTLAGAPNGSYRIEVFLSDSCDASGHGEGRELIGSFAAADDNGDGIISFTRALKRPNAWTFVTATATPQAGPRGTSEFSACRAIAVDPGPGIELIGSDSAVEDQFGRSVAVSGSFAVVGAPAHNGGTGAAYVFQNNDGTWAQVAKLVAGDAASNDGFGHAVAISGNRIAVGAPFDDSNRGAVYVFGRDEVGNWLENAKLLPADALAGDEFGISVAISGDSVVGGAVFNDHSTLANPGAAYLFVRNPTSGAWVQSTKLAANDPQAESSFGISVAMSGDRIAVGAHRDDGTDGPLDSGTAYVFRFEPIDGVWFQDVIVRPGDSGASDNFGLSLSLSGAVLLVGAPFDDDGGNNTGSAYVFDVGDGVVQVAKLASSTPAAGNFFGTSVSIVGDRLVVGASGAGNNESLGGEAHEFQAVSGVWTHLRKLVAPDAVNGMEFGGSVSFTPGTIAVGARFGNGNVLGSGSAYIFQ